MEDQILKLERLAGLKQSGVLTSDEFEEQKRLLFATDVSGGSQSSDVSVAASSAFAPPVSADLSQKWQDRFAFFDAVGSPKSPAAKEAVRALPFSDRGKYVFNLWAFFFGPFYFLILGIWKPALTLLGVMVATSVVLTILEFDTLDKFLPIISGVLYATTANYAYYLKRAKGVETWNPFLGMF